MERYAFPIWHGGAVSHNVMKTEFDFVLKSVGNQKLKVLQELYKILGQKYPNCYSLKETKMVVDSCWEPSWNGGNSGVIMERLSESDANDFKQRLESLGAEIDLK